MCLTIKSWFTPKVKIAITDIVCYKFMFKTANPDIFTTPFYRSEIRMGKTYESKLICYKSKTWKTWFWEKSMFYVDYGLHTFATRAFAKQRTASCDVVAKCIIPAGSKYYTGVFTKDKSYASDKLTYLGIIE